MKKWMTVFAFGGLLSTTGFVQDSTMDAESTASATTFQTATDTEPCFGCCPVAICGMNGPSFDGTTADAECSAK